jgi:hypothetical protein
MPSRKWLLTLGLMVTMVIIGLVSPDFPLDILDRMLVLALGWTGVQGAADIVREARQHVLTPKEVDQLLPSKTPTGDGDDYADE